MTLWLIDGAELDAIEASRDATQISLDRFAAIRDEPVSAEYERSGDVARINVSGVLTQKPDPWSRLFGSGNTTYSDIQAKLRAADADPNVSSIELAIDSPGGQVDGLFDTVDAIRAAKKPTRTVATLATSAAYALAASTGEIVATNRMATFGSIGIVTSRYVSKSVVDVTSTAAPKKRPDASTEEGKAAIREHLDEIHGLFAEAIATGRNVSAQTVNETYGQGGLLLANAAIERGMIDKIAGPDLRAVGTTGEAEVAPQATEKKDMKWSEYKAAHPAEAALAVAEGVEAERKRVSAHLKLGESCGDISIAVGAIREGKDFDAEIQADYMAASMNRQDRTARSDDDDKIAAAVDGANTDSADGPDLGDLLADSLGAPKLEA